MAAADLDAPGPDRSSAVGLPLGPVVPCCRSGRGKAATACRAQTPESGSAFRCSPGGQLRAEFVIPEPGVLLP